MLSVNITNNLILKTIWKCFWITTQRPCNLSDWWNFHATLIFFCVQAIRTKQLSRCTWNNTKKYYIFRSDKFVSKFWKFWKCYKIYFLNAKTNNNPHSEMKIRKFRDEKLLAKYISLDDHSLNFCLVNLKNNGTFSAERIFFWFFVAHLTPHHSTPRHSKRFLPTQLSSLHCHQTIKP